MPLIRDITLSNWLDPPFNRRSFLRVREVVPTARIPCGGDVLELPSDPQPLDDLAFAAVDGGTTTLARHLDATYVDGICVLHRGRIVYERYLNGLRPETTHLLMSVSKSFCGSLAGVLVGAGVLDPEDLVTDHAPDLAGTSLAGATVRHVLDMTAGTAFVEDYEVYRDPDSDHPLLEYERDAGYRPSPGRLPRGVVANFATLPLARPHGEFFDYRSPLTNMLAYVLEQAAATPFPELLSRELFSRLGPEHDAEIMLDPRGFPVIEGGMCCTLRDLARFGLALVQRGRVGETQLIPASWIADVADPPAASIAAFAAAPDADTRPTKGYRSAFWVVEPGRSFSASGIFGQGCYVDLEHDLVVARLSSAPEALSEERRAEAMNAIEALVQRLEVTS